MIVYSRMKSLERSDRENDWLINPKGVKLLKNIP